MDLRNGFAMDLRDGFTLTRSKAPQPVTQLYAVGKLVGCFGIKGFIKLQPLTQTPERFDDLTSVEVGTSPETSRPFVIESIESKHKGMVVKFASIDDRSAAEKFVGQYIFVDEQQLLRPEKGTYFIHELIGCEVVSTDGRSVGIVNEVYRVPGQDLWEVQHGDATSLIPASGEFIKEVDIAKKKITVRLIDGLFDETGNAE